MRYPNRCRPPVQDPCTRCTHAVFAMAGTKIVYLLQQCREEKVREDKFGVWLAPSPKPRDTDLAKSLTKKMSGRTEPTFVNRRTSLWYNQLAAVVL